MNTLVTVSALVCIFIAGAAIGYCFGERLLSKIQTSALHQGTSFFLPPLANNRTYLTVVEYEDGVKQVFIGKPFCSLGAKNMRIFADGRLLISADFVTESDTSGKNAQDNSNKADGFRYNRHTHTISRAIGD